MKILRYDFTFNWDEFTTEEEKNLKDFFEFKLENSNLLCEFILSSGIKNRFTLNIKDFSNSCVEVTLQRLEDPNTLVICPAFSNYAYANRLANRTLGPDDKRILRIFINESGSDCDIFLMSNYPVEVPNFENIVILPGKTYTQVMSEYSVYGKNILDKVKKKSSLLGNLDNGNSIAYLEAQVDVLTRYVLNKHMNDIDDEELRAILIAANEYSVLDIKSKDKLIEEMTHKAHTRQEQLKYYGSN